MLPDPIESIEQSLGTGLDLPRDSIEALSGLDGDSLDRFRELWSRLGSEEREAVLDSMGEAAEENLVLDFMPVYVMALGDPDEVVREIGIRLASEEARPELLETYLRAAVSDPDPEVRRAAVEELSAYTLTAQIDDWPQDRQVQIERALVGILHLPNADTEMRKAALLSLSFLATPQTEVEIRQAHLQPDLRITAVEAMGRNCQEVWIPDIKTEMKDSDAELRAIALQAAAELEDPELLPDVIQALSDSDDDVKLAAIDALGAIGGEAARDALSELLQSRHRDIRDAAKEAIRQLIENEDPFSLS